MFHALERQAALTTSLRPAKCSASRAMPPSRSAAINRLNPLTTPPLPLLLRDADELLLLLRLLLAASSPP